MEGAQRWVLVDNQAVEAVVAVQAAVVAPLARQRIWERRSSIRGAERGHVQGSVLGRSAPSLTQPVDYMFLLILPH